MEKAIKFSEDELHQIKTFQEKYAQITATLGSLTLQQTLVDDELDKTKKQYTIIRTSEQEFANGLTKKYGDGTINIDTGEFIPQKVK